MSKLRVPASEEIERIIRHDWRFHPPAVIDAAVLTSIRHMRSRQWNWPRPLVSGDLRLLDLYINWEIVDRPWMRAGPCGAD